MSLLKDITASYRAPRTEMHRQTARGITEPHTLMLAFLLGVLLFVSRLPALLNESVDSGQLFFHLFAQNLVSFVFVAPLGLYLIATALYWTLRPFGACCGGKIARYTFIWSFVIALPFVLGLGLAAPFNIAWLDQSLAVIAFAIFAIHYTLAASAVFFTKESR